MVRREIWIGGERDDTVDFESVCRERGEIFLEREDTVT